MHVENKILFHIHTYTGELPFFEVGKVYRTYEEHNFFRKFFDQMELISPDQRFSAPAFFADLAYREGKIDLIGLGYLANAIREAGMFIRELIFEEIRKDFFSHLPSRNSCIYLSDLEGIKYWLNWFDGNPKKQILLKVEATGNLHIGNQSFLDSDINGYNDYKNRALSYWKGLKVENNSNNEIIFNGEIKILEILDRHSV